MCGYTAVQKKDVLVFTYLFIYYFSRHVAEWNGVHTVLPATHTFIHEWNEPSCMYFVSIHQMAPRRPRKVAHIWISLLLIYRPRKDERLSRLSWLTL